MGLYFRKWVLNNPLFMVILLWLLYGHDKMIQLYEIVPKTKNHWITKLVLKAHLKKQKADLDRITKVFMDINFSRAGEALDKASLIALDVVNSRIETGTELNEIVKEEPR